MYPNPQDVLPLPPRPDVDHYGYRKVPRMLAHAGADVKPEWLDDDRLRADRDLHAALSARINAR